MSSSPRRSPGRGVEVSLAPILSVNFVGTLGFSIVLPFLVFLVTRWGGNALVYGVMGATYSGFQLIGAPILGRWSDVYGRRRILLLSQLGTLASWIIFVAAFLRPEEPLATIDSRILGRFALTLPLIVMFVARAADGITGGNVSVANAYLADITEEADRNANFGKMAVSANLGFIVGPAVAGLLGATAWGELLPVLAGLAISLVATLIIVLKLPESPGFVELWSAYIEAFKTLGVNPYVGRHLVSMLHQAGARLLLADVQQDRATDLGRELDAQVVDTLEILSVACDIYAPCARGAGVNAETRTFFVL